MERKRISTTVIAVTGALLVILIFILGSIWMGRSAKNDTEEAVRSVSLLYLDELAGRREQVVESNLNNRMHDLEVALSMMTEEDLKDVEHLQAFQARMKTIYGLEKFAFVDTKGLIYTALRTQTNIDDYNFDYLTIAEPEISVLNLQSADKKVIIAVPVNRLRLQAEELVACFMEIGMEEMLQGVSLKSANEGITFCNIYTGGGVALTNTVLGGLAMEDNLLDAMQHADFEGGYSYDRFIGE